MRLYSPAVCLAFGLLAGAATASAQTSNYSTGSQTGTFGTRSLGQGVSAGTRTFGGSSMLSGAGGSGMGSAGSRMGMGGSGGMGTGLGAGGTPGAAAGNVGQLNASERFLRSNRQPGAFVGADTGDTANYLLGGTANSRTSTQGLRGGGLTGRNNLLGGANMVIRRQGTGQAGFNQAGTSRTGANASAGARGLREIPTAMRVSFDYPKPSGPGVSTTLAKRLARTPGVRTLSPVEVTVQDGTATLRGVVSSQHDREIAERLALLEVGIWHVQNELVVAARSETATGSKPLAPSSPATGSPTPPSTAPELVPAVSR